MSIKNKRIIEWTIDFGTRNVQCTCTNISNIRKTELRYNFQIVHS